MGAPSALLDAVGIEKGKLRKSILETPAYYHVPRREREGREYTSRGTPRKIVLWATAAAGGADMHRPSSTRVLSPLSAPPFFSVFPDFSLSLGLC